MTQRRSVATSEAKTSESFVRVRYVETDQMAIAHHSSYIVWLEIGRTDLCRAVGISYRDIEARGLLLVVAEIGCRYRSSFRYDDEVRITTSIAEWGSRGLTFAYELSDAATGEVRAIGFSAHLWIDSASRKPVRPPADMAALFAPWVP